jgi:hypothetical protein
MLIDRFLVEARRVTGHPHGAPNSRLSARVSVALTAWLVLAATPAAAEPLSGEAQA